MHIFPFISGAALGASLIIAIGAQNAFVLQQGLRRQHVFVVAALCAFLDAALIALGAAGFGAVVSGSPVLASAAAWGGAIFLFGYGLRSVLAARRDEVLAVDGPVTNEQTLRTAVMLTLAVTLLNPHVYLDTVVLLGSVAARYPGPERTAFAMGAMSASFVWFFSLAYGAGRLAPLFARPKAWQVLHLAIAAVMWWIAGSLVLGQLVG